MSICRRRRRAAYDYYYYYYAGQRERVFAGRFALDARVFPERYSGVSRIMSGKLAVKTAEALRNITRVRSLREPLWSPRTTAALQGVNASLNWSLARHDAAPVGVEYVYRNLRAKNLVSHCIERYGSAYTSALVAHGNAERPAGTLQLLPPAASRRTHQALVADYLCRGGDAFTSSSCKSKLYVLDGAFGSDLETCLASRVVCDDPVVALALTHWMERLPAGALDLNVFSPDIVVYIGAGYHGRFEENSGKNGISSSPPRDKASATRAPDGNASPGLAHVTTDGQRVYIGASVQLNHMRSAIGAAASLAMLSTRRGIDPERYGLILNGQLHSNGRAVLGVDGQHVMWTHRGLARGWRDVLRLEDWRSSVPPPKVTQRQWQQRVAFPSGDASGDTAMKSSSASAIAPLRVPSTPNLVLESPLFLIALDHGGVRRSSSDTSKRKRKTVQNAEQQQQAQSEPDENRVQVVPLKNPQTAALYALAVATFPVPENLLEISVRDFVAAYERANARALLVCGTGATSHVLQLAADSATPSITGEAVPGVLQEYARQCILDRYRQVGQQLLAQHGPLATA
jgi:hypothetical protein